MIDGHGVAHTVPISSDGLLETLIEGDLEPILRSEFPAAVRSAADGDTAALARLEERAASGEASEAEEPSESFDNPLYYATSCEDEPFPWNRAASPATRLAEAKARIGALGASQLAPFTRANVLDLSDVPACAFWPYTTPAPAPDTAPFPSVPTLILSGADDLRTPSADAREVAAQIPGSHLLVVPNTGHSVLSSDPTHCASDALQALFAGKPIEPCKAVAPPAILRLTPLAPARLADLAPAPGSHGLPGRTLQAVVLTLRDFSRQLTLQLVKQLESSELGGSLSLRTGGLRAGWAGLTGATLTFHRYSYVPGVTISGKITAKASELRIGGSAAAHGTLRLGSHKQLDGVLGSEHVQTADAEAQATSTAQTAAEAQTASAQMARFRGSYR